MASLLGTGSRIIHSVPRLSEAKWVRKLVTKVALDKVTANVPSRPYAFCQMPEYTTWRGLTDRRITGRHLDFPTLSTEDLPTVDALLPLFFRSGAMKPCPRSSLLFAAFAQWFTDSFLRTSHGFEYDANGAVVIDATTKRPKRSADRHAKNDSNHEIDLCQIYGLREEQTSILRVGKPPQNERGFLGYEKIGGEIYPRRLLSKPAAAKQPLNIFPEYAELHDERLLRVIFDDIDKNEDRSSLIWAVGLEHGNSTLGNSLFNTIFLREHNRVAAEIGRANPDWEDERVFQTTRNVLIVIVLKIVVADYIRHITPGDLPFDVFPGLADDKRWYRTNRISIEFNLLYRWHELIPDAFDFVPVEDFRHNNNWIVANGVETLVEELSSRRAGSIVMGNLAIWLKGVQLDTLELMRASRLAPYTAYRKRFGLPVPKKFDDVTKDPTRLAALKKAYPKGIDSLEWFVGMYAEDHGDKAMMGDLMLRMVAYDAFTQALTNPLLASGVYGEAAFSRRGLEIVEETEALSQVIRRNTTRPIKHCSFAAP